MITGKTPPTDSVEYFTGDELFVSPKDLTRNSYYVEKTSTRLSEKALEKFRGQVIPRDAVMFTSLSFAFGKMGIASRTCLTNQQINSIVVNGQHSPRFTYYLLRAYEPFIFSYNSGIDTPIVPKSVFERIPIVVPRRAVQQKIAAILSTYDDLLVNNRRRIVLLESIGEEIYREWFVRARGENYRKYELDQKRFHSFCGFEKGKTPLSLASEPGEDSLAYLTADVLDGNPPDYWVASGPQCTRVSQGEVLMLMDGARSGRVFRGPAGAAASTVAVIRTEEKYQSMLYHYLRQMQDVITWNNTGSAIPHANKDFINRMLVPVIIGDEALRRFNRLQEPIFSQVQVLRNLNEILRSQRDSLLLRLISGKICVDKLDIEIPSSMKAEQIDAV